MKACCVHPSLLSIIALFTAIPALAEQTDTDLILQNALTAPQNTYPVDVYDIYGPLPLPDPIGWFPFIIAGSLLIIFILIFLLLKRKKKSTIPVVPPHVTALAELELAREHLVNNQSLIYADRISEILRRYIERRFTVTSTRQTTAEFLHTIETAVNSGGPELLPHKDALKQCMDQCDMAKFAHKTADKKSMEEMESGVRRFIDSTRPVVEGN